MSYPRDLDEYDESELQAELNLRLARRRKGLCDYCNRESHTPACKFPERHRKTIEIDGDQGCSYCGRLPGSPACKCLVTAKKKG